MDSSDVARRFSFFCVRNLTSCMDSAHLASDERVKGAISRVPRDGMVRDHSRLLLGCWREDEVARVSGGPGGQGPERTEGISGCNEPLQDR